MVRPYEYCLRRLSASSQDQALAALLFVSRHVLTRNLGWLGGIARTRMPTTLPLVPTPTDVRATLARLRGSHRLPGPPMNSGGIRIYERASVRLKDLNRERLEIVAEPGKGRVDHVPTLPATIIGGALKRITELIAAGRVDAELDGFVEVTTPYGFDWNFPPAPRAVPWPSALPAARRCRDGAGALWRRHRGGSEFQRTAKSTVRRSELNQKASCQTFRHSFATRLLDAVRDLRTARQLMGYGSVRTTMGYVHRCSHLVACGAWGTRSPLSLQYVEYTMLPGRWAAPSGPPGSAS